MAERVNPQGNKLGRFAQVRQRLATRADSEHEQALVRVAIGLAILIYSVTLDVRAGLSWSQPTQIAVVFVLFSLLLCAAILARPVISVRRRYVAMVADNATNTYYMALAGVAGAPLYGVYLWVTIGYGVRYGARYLLACQIMSIAGFGLVWYASEFWSRYMALSGGLMLTLVAVPLYAAGLLGRLSKALAKAESANAAKSRFLATISHEIRTPLNGVLGIAQLLRPQAANDKQRDLLETLEESSEALLALIENVLDISKIEAGKQEIVRTSFELAALLSGVQRLFQFSAQQKSIALTLRVAPELPETVIGDENKLRQVLMNLVGNAIKFTPDGGSVTLSCVRVSTEVKRVLLRFEVEDTGLGIPAEVQEKIFEPFTQGDESITRRYGGSGLGTTIAKQLVVLMGGSIGVDSVEGKGSRFWFSLPLESLQRAGEHSRPTPAYSRVLLAGLTASERESCVGHLAGWGVRYFDADTLAVGVSALRNAQPAFRFAIIGGNGLDLREAARVIAAEAAEARAVLVGIYSEKTACSVEELFELGYAALLPPSMDKTVLFNALHADTNPQRAREVSVAAISALGWPGAFPSYRILLADDNATNRKIVESALERAGHQVCAVASGEAALDQLANDRFDLAILDVRMPEMSGLDVVKVWRMQEASGQRMPILMLSADATQDAARSALTVGAQDFLAKPVRFGELLQRVHQLAAQQDASAALPRSPHAEPAAGQLDQLDPIRAGALEELAALGSTPGFLAHLLEGFVADTQRALLAMEMAIQDEDAQSFRDNAHAIRGSASNIGAQRLVQLCAQAKSLSGHGMGQRHPVLLAQLRAEFARVREALRHHLQARQRSGR